MFVLTERTIELTDNEKRKAGEPYLDYFVRLFQEKNNYQLNCDQIADLLNYETGKNYGESTYRKEWAAFNRGRVYERKRSDTGVCTRILSLSDFHVPFQIDMEHFSDYAGKIDILVLNGDLLDHQAISRFDKTYRVNPMEEMISCRQYLLDLIEYLHPKKVLVNFGNHEKRFGSYISKSLDSEIKELMPDSALDLIFVDGFHHYNKRTHSKVWYKPVCEVFTDIDVNYTGDWKCKVGKAWFAHPIAFSSGTLKTCEKAMDYFHKTDIDPFDTVVLAHTHRTGDSKKGNVTLYEQGACCQTEKMDYTDGKLYEPQQKGFVYICQDKCGSLLYDKSKRIILS